MSNTKIVIDKERFDIEVNHLKEEYNIILRIPHTEIQIDQSIEERAKNYAVEKWGHRDEDTETGFEEGATSQQIIDQLNVNEKDVNDSELFTIKLTKKEVMMLKSCLSSLYQNRIPAGDVLSFASKLEDEVKEYIKSNDNQTKSKGLKCTRCGSEKLTLCSVDEFACDDCGEFPITN